MFSAESFYEAKVFLKAYKDSIDCIQYPIETHGFKLSFLFYRQGTEHRASLERYQHRVKIVGDAFSVDLGNTYDVVLIPNFLHHFKVADCTRFLKRIHAALRPGGRVVIVEFVPNNDRITPPAAASFSLIMLGTTPEGDAYTLAEYSEILKNAGFHGIELHALPPTAESAILASA